MFRFNGRVCQVNEVWRACGIPGIRKKRRIHLFARYELLYISLLQPDKCIDATYNHDIFLTVLLNPISSSQGGRNVTRVLLPSRRDPCNLAQVPSAGHFMATNMVCYAQPCRAMYQEGGIEGSIWLMVVIGSGQLSDMIKAGGGRCVGQMSQNTTHLVATASDWESKSAKGRGFL